MLGRALAAAIVAVAIAGCHPPRPADKPPPPPPPPAHVNSCADACNHRASLGCLFQDGCNERCGIADDQAFIDCEAAAVDCPAIARCDMGDHQLDH